ncbi:MAG: hypothetical protein JWM80_412 [Cyanobacteria bacterium RYN_339]|nr:hypothetical protein [Cyanobacteria bacterium RYN_339]
MRKRRGQALVEFALIAPLLVLMLAGIVYCGGLILAQENLTIAARSTARQMAMKATENALVGGKSAVGNGSMAQAALSDATGGARGLSAAAPAWPGGVHKVNAYTAVYSRTMSKRIGKHSYQFGVGCLLYGVQVKKDLSHDLSPMARLANAVGGRLSSVAALGANAVMPGDLPPSGGVGIVDSAGGGASVLGLNTWITGIVNEKNP